MLNTWKIYYSDAEEFVKYLRVNSDTQHNIIMFKIVAKNRYPNRGFFYISYDYDTHRLDYFEVLDFDDYISKKQMTYKGTSKTILRKEKLKKIHEIQ